MLHALLDDFQKMRGQIESHRRYNEAIFDSTTVLLEAATGSEHNLDPADIDTLIGNVVWYNSASDWESASMELLISAGDLASLSDANLVQRLASLHRILETIRRRYRRDEDFYRDKMIPFLGVNANLPQILAGIEHAPGVPEWSYDFSEVGVTDTDDHTHLLSTAEFQGLLAAKIDVQHNILKYALRELSDELDKVIALLEVGLDK